VPHQPDQLAANLCALLRRQVGLGLLVAGEQLAPCDRLASDLTPGLSLCIVSLVAGTAIGVLRLLGQIQVPGYAALAVLITFSTSATLAAIGGLRLAQTAGHLNSKSSLPLADTEE